MQFRGYQPIQPLPLLEFEPDCQVDIPTLYGTTSFEAERYGAFCVTRYPDGHGGYWPNWWAVLHILSGALQVVYQDLRVARSFALDLDERWPDSDQLWINRHRSANDRAQFEVFIDFLKTRRKHPALAPYQTAGVID